MKISLDTEKLTIGDLEDFEEAAGVPLSDAMQSKPVQGADGQVEKDEKGRPVMAVSLPAKVLKALVWIIARKDDPNFTLADARNVTVTELEFDGDDAESSDVQEKDESA